MFLRGAEGGAVALFEGTTRRFTGGKETVRLQYEAHESMAVKEMEKLCALAHERWPVLKAVIVHRLGEVPVGETSVLVGVATAHRGPAFEACQFLIDELKKSVPVWKRELYADGRTEWVSGSWEV